MRHQMTLHGFMPLVATIAGFVATGAEITDLQDEDTEPDAPWSTFGGPVPPSRLSLRPAGDWFADFAEARLVTGPGQPGLVIGCNHSARTASAALRAPGAGSPTRQNP
jgi:hypothetical protein